MRRGRAERTFGPSLRRPPCASGEAGFSLTEVLVALVLTGLVLSALATITAQWLPGWQRGLARISDSEALALAMERMTADLSAALFVPSSGTDWKPLFIGTETAVTFVRPALGPNAEPGLELVRLSTGDAGGIARRAAPFAPQGEAALSPAFGAAAALLGPRIRVSFSYAGSDALWRPAWANASTLPQAVRIVLRDARTGRTLDMSSAVVIRTELPARCATYDSTPPCQPSAAPRPRTALSRGEGE